MATFWQQKISKPRRVRVDILVRLKSANPVKLRVCGLHASKAVIKW